MNIGVCELWNFGSYKYLKFDYANLGLALVSGPTGVGKSTVLDAPGWVAFGVTAKELNADDVKSWDAEEETKGIVTLHLPNRTVVVTRIRGKRSHLNDLFYEVTYEDGKNPGVTRGKDASDTQRLLCEELGVTGDLYLAASYIHQFTSDKFFTAKAKERRESMEKIADMRVAIRLGSAASDARKEAKRDLDVKRQHEAKVVGKLEVHVAALASQKASLAAWDKKHTADMAAVSTKSYNFAAEQEARVMDLVTQLEVLDGQIQPEGIYPKRLAQAKEQLGALGPIEQQLSDLNTSIGQAEAELKQAQRALARVQATPLDCPTCQRPLDNADPDRHGREVLAGQAEVEAARKVVDDLKASKAATEAYLKCKPKLVEAIQKVGMDEHTNKAMIEKARSIQAQALSLREQENPYEAQLAQLVRAVNPHKAQVLATTKSVAEMTAAKDAADADLAALDRRISALTWLYDKSYELRGLCLEQAVRAINERTNAILDRHFDAAIRVQFSLVDSDKLEVFITNGGHDCKYNQLSGGERAMLKLAFSIGYMQAAENTAGIKFGTLMLDEAMNGLDADLKVRAFGVLEEIEPQYTSVLLVDHAEEFKQLFSNRFSVTKSGTSSEVAHDGIE